MGLAVAIIYLPLYLFFSSGAIYAALKIRKRTVSEEKTKSRYRHIFVGFIAGTLLTWWLVWLVPVKGNTDYEAFVNQLALTLLTPVVFGVILFGFIKLARLRQNWHCVDIVSGVLFSTIAIPWLTIVAASYYDDVVNFPKYHSLCANAEIKFLERLKPAKSVFLSPDLFTNSARGSRAVTRSVGTFLLNQSALEYVERPSGSGSVYPYERMRTEGERILSSRGDETTKYITSPIDTITAEYIVTPRSINFPEEKINGIGGSQIDIRRLSDNKLIAYAKYYWDNKTHKSCPSETQSGLFVYKFIATALNVINEKSNIEGLASYQGARELEK